VPCLVSLFGAFFVFFRTAMPNRSSKRHVKATYQTEEGVQPATTSSRACHVVVESSVDTR
jgi:hypothetical protein